MIIRRAATEQDLTAVAGLFRDYSASLAVDLIYQNFDTEVAELPGKYALPGGALLFAALEERRPIGCVGLRPLGGAGACEMKRLYVAPAGRGVGVGKALISAVIEEARSKGYRDMYLDTLPSMTAAQELYRRIGFESAQPYYDTPVAGTKFMRLRLHP